MRPIWFVRALKFGILALVVIAGFGQAVLQLWNWLMPAIFGLPSLHFWQAVGLLALSRILVGGMRGGPHFAGHWRHRMAERMQMRPGDEEIEWFQRGLEQRYGRCGGKPAGQNKSDAPAPTGER